MKKITIYLLLFLITVSAVSAGGSREEPELEVETSGTQYISPNMDGVQDFSVLDFTVSLYAKSKSGYVPEYGIRIKDSAGNLVNEMVKTEKSDINWFVRLFTRYSKFTLEKSVFWDGKDSRRNVVPEGVYDLFIWIKDPAGNIREAALDQFVVDLTPPSVTLEAPENRVFSPGRFDVLDSFAIRHRNSSEEPLWKAEILDAEDNVIRSYSWEGRLPEVLEWDGTDENRVIQPDGEYVYRINSTDLAGNTMEEQEIEGIVIDTRNPDLIFELSDRYVSPNNDGVKDTITLTFGQKEFEGLKEWRVSLSDKDGRKLINYTGEEPGVYEAVFDGRDDSGNDVPDGVYTVSFVSEYDNGAVIVDSGQIMVDRKPPVITVSVTNRVFSPFAEDGGNQAEIEMKSDETVTWQGSVKDSSGNIIIETSSRETTSLVVWDGTDEKGEVLPDGNYHFNAVFTDLAGNSTQPPTEVITIDRIKRSADIVVIPGAVRVREGRDGSGIYFKVTADDFSNVDNWSLGIKESSTGKETYIFEGTEKLPDHVLWNGTVKETGEAAEEGFYDAYFYVLYKNGITSEREIKDIFYDLTPPVIEASVTATPFAKDGINYEAEVEFVIDVIENHKVYDWSMAITDHNSIVLKTYGGDGDPDRYIEWYGETAGNTRIYDDSRLEAEITVTDMSGNTSTVILDIPFDPVIVKRDGRYYLDTPDIIFSAYRYELDSAEREKAEANISSLNKVQLFAGRYPYLKIIVEGHALNVLLGTGGERERREEAILETLTENRALTVTRELERSGVSSQRIEIKAEGGKKPVVSVTDLEERWKNRRVIFNIDFMD